MSQPTKSRLIEAGLRMLLERGYNNLGLQALLEETAIPKGSFYHHFVDKEDFALQVIDAYIGEVHTVLDACLGDKTQPPLARIRKFFEIVRLKYREDGYMGCLMGGTGAGIVWNERGVSAKDRMVFLFDRRAPGHLRRGCKAMWRGCCEPRQPGDGQSARRLLGRCCAAQPAAQDSNVTRCDA